MSRRVLFCFQYIVFNFRTCVADIKKIQPFLHMKTFLAAVTVLTYARAS